MIVLRVVLIGMVVFLMVSCGQKADNESDTTATTEQIEKTDKASAVADKTEEPIMRREFEGELSQIQSGVHLQLKYDPEAGAFVGTMRNATIQPVMGVQIMVTLSDGTEFGPTDAIDLEPGRPYDINLPTDGSEITTWSARITAGSDKAIGKAKTE